MLNGRLYWVEDAYTTTANFPYAQQANPVGTSRLPGTSELGYENFNYIRNSVKCVVDAYNGTMWFFVQDPNDPIIEVYERAFPKLFTKMSEANSIIPDITSHWRYPEDLFTVQTDMYGRYHQTNAQVFYTNSQQWGIAQNPSSGEVNAATTTVPPLPGALGTRTASPRAERDADLRADCPAGPDPAELCPGATVRPVFQRRQAKPDRVHDRGVRPR